MNEESLQQILESMLQIDDSKNYYSRMKITRYST